MHEDKWCVLCKWHSGRWGLGLALYEMKGGTPAYGSVCKLQEAMQRQKKACMRGEGWVSYPLPYAVCKFTSTSTWDIRIGIGEICAITDVTREYP